MKPENRPLTENTFPLSGIWIIAAVFQQGGGGQFTFPPVQQESPISTILFVKQILMDVQQIYTGVKKTYACRAVKSLQIITSILNNNKNTNLINYIKLLTSFGNRTYDSKNFH